MDVTHQINAVRRKVGSRTMEAGEARTVTIAQTYAAPIEDVWDACTDPERIPRWFLPVSGDLRLGGRYQLEGNAGGTIERCDPPNEFAATWEFAGQVSWIEVRLTAESGNSTRFELEHITHVDDHWDQFGPGAVGVGWDGALLGLAGHLTSDPGAIDPAQAMAWARSEEGRRFWTLSSERWCEANLAAGADETWARAAADRTTAAYTTPPQPAGS
ncbi:SRPBCC family protein [Actinoallomurus soli]|uniref:SRPBCC family protein n=1 Tax=Actinoallomurus soli TaxID=2952535 RepID=UPI0020922521|nr:SRPBCC family protein [Actinoallomurus soli]MCO5973986.1 SRPBCC family protein [Actinoallomurus soli]